MGQNLQQNSKSALIVVESKNWSQIIKNFKHFPKTYVKDTLLARNKISEPFDQDVASKIKTM